MIENGVAGCNLVYQALVGLARAIPALPGPGGAAPGEFLTIVWKYTLVGGVGWGGAGAGGR